MNKKALVTGGSRGIGKGIVLHLAKIGYDVAFTHYEEPEEAQAVLHQILQCGGRGFCYQASLQKPDVPEHVVQQAIRDLEGIDVLICNAGKTQFASIRTLSVDQMDETYALNYRSYLLCTKTAVEAMIASNTHGRIIFISSTRGVRAYRNDHVYGSLKAALNRAVESLAIELAQYGITINAIAPGATAVRNLESESSWKDGHISSLVPLGRKAKPEDIAGLVEYLIGEDAGYMTGDTIRIDGGLILYGPNEDPEGGMF